MIPLGVLSVPRGGRSRVGGTRLVTATKLAGRCITFPGNTVARLISRVSAGFLQWIAAVVGYAGIRCAPHSWVQLGFAEVGMTTILRPGKKTKLSVQNEF